MADRPPARPGRRTAAGTGRRGRQAQGPRRQRRSARSGRARPDVGGIGRPAARTTARGRDTSAAGWARRGQCPAPASGGAPTTGPDGGRRAATTAGRDRRRAPPVTVTAAIERGRPGTVADRDRDRPRGSGRDDRARTRADRTAGTGRPRRPRPADRPRGVHAAVRRPARPIAGRATPASSGRGPAGRPWRRPPARAARSAVIRRVRAARPPRRTRARASNRSAEDEELVAGRRPVEEAFVAGRAAHRLLVVPQRRQALEQLVLHATRLRIPIVEVEGGSLTALAGFDGHQGVALVVEPRRFASLDDILARAIERDEPPFVLVLDSLEDPQNVGTLLRSAEAAGVHGVIFPTHRQAPLTPVRDQGLGRRRRAPAPVPRRRPAGRPGRPPHPWPADRGAEEDAR